MTTERRATGTHATTRATTRATAKWAAGARVFAENARRSYAARHPGHSASATARAAPMARPDESAAQREMTGITWNAAAIDLDAISHVGVEKARHRFRAALPALVWNAAALEGNTFTLPEVQTLLDGVTVSGRKIEEEQQILALSEGYSQVDEWVGAGAFALTKSTSNALHGLIARHEAIEAGHFRGEGTATGGGAVRLAAGGVVDGVPTDQLPERWSRLVDYLTGIPDARLRALVFAASATRSQYYFDGNKRTARLMMTGELLAHGFDAVNIPHARRLEFNVALDQLFTTDDATMLLAFTASCAHA